jgi:hypothetical protein
MKAAVPTVMRRIGFLLLTVAPMSLVLAQQGRPFNPRYLSEFPPVDRILNDIHADDPLENAARQMGALLQMNHIIVDLSEGRAARNQLTSDEFEKVQTYKAAQSRILATLADKTARAARGYDSDLTFRQELVKRYFSAALQAQWARANASAATAAPSAARPPSSSAKPAVSPPDRGIVKAQAAGVDTKVFGIPLGDPVALPKCDNPSRTQVNCFVIVGGDPLSGLLGAIVGAPPKPRDDKTELTIYMAEPGCPTWLTTCTFLATVQGGRLVAAFLGTKGRGVERTVAAELRSKYGNRVSMQERIITPNNGAQQFSVQDLDWELPGLHVEYKVVDNTINDGYVRIESETLYEARRAKERGAARPKL